jgi:hypothetical protein
VNKTILPINVRRVRLVMSVLGALLISALAVSIALAHETRAVGKYKFIVGFVNEPALLNQPNSIDLRVTVSDTAKPVEGLDKTLKAEVIYGASTMSIPLTARFGQPGAYNADFIPTKPGTYIFHFTGAVEGNTVDEKFESGPGRFNDVVDTSNLQFPVKVPAPADAAAQLKAAQDAASSAQTLAYVGIALGVLGVIIGGLGFVRRK